MVAKTAASYKPRIYGLDRIKELRRTGRSYKIPKKFTAKSYFKDLYGACIEDSKYAEEVEIKVDKPQVHYFNSSSFTSRRLQLRRPWIILYSDIT